MIPLFFFLCCIITDSSQTKDPLSVCVINPKDVHNRLSGFKQITGSMGGIVKLVCRLPYHDTFNTCYTKLQGNNFDASMGILTYV